MKLLLAVIALTSSLFLAETAMAYKKRKLTFEQFKKSCTHPGQFHAQRAPMGIKITCTARETNWLKVQQEESPLSLPTVRTMDVSLISDKYSVAKKRLSAENEDADIDCPMYKEMEMKVSVGKSLTCRQVLNSTIEEICDEAVRDASDAVDPVETGRTYNVCKRQTQQQGRRRKQ